MKYRVYVLLGFLLLSVPACCTTPDSKITGQPAQGGLIPGNETERWLHSVIIDDVDYRAANFFDCISLIQKHLDEYASRNKTKAPRFVYDVELVYYKDAPLPTFKAKGISALELMKILEEVCRLRFVAKSELIIVEKK